MSGLEPFLGRWRPGRYGGGEERGSMCEDDDENQGDVEREAAEQTHGVSRNKSESRSRGTCRSRRTQQ